MVIAKEPKYHTFFKVFWILLLTISRDFFPNIIFLAAKKNFEYNNDFTRFFKYYFLGVLKETVGLCKAGASVRDICIQADKRVEEDTGKAFKKDKNIQKGNFIITEKNTKTKNLNFEN